MVMQASGGVMTRNTWKDLGSRAGFRPGGWSDRFRSRRGGQGYPNLLCVDMGGTSYDMSVVLNGAAPARGLESAPPLSGGRPHGESRDTRAGGGSICHVNKGVLQVGT